MSTRRRFSGDFKPKVALEALRGDKTIQEIATRHKIHPNQVSTWKQRAVEAMKEVFSNGSERARGDHEAEVRDLHAKIGSFHNLWRSSYSCAREIDGWWARPGKWS